MTVETHGLVSFAEVEAAAERLVDVAIRTPLLRVPDVETAVDAEVRLKVESFQRTGSFKFRGAYNHIAQLGDAEAAPGVITYSSGNHAQAVALSARLRGIPAVVVMPRRAPEIKRAGAIRLGARVISEGDTSVERRVRAEAIQREEGLHMVPPFDDPWIIAGQGTAAREAALAWPEMDTWLVCIGGGGLGSGSAVALRAMRPGATIIGVEAEGAASMRRSLDAGHPVTLDTIDTIADGLAPVRPGDLTFRHVSALFDDVVTVTDEAIRETTRHLLHEHKLVVEFSGAAALAALRSGAVHLPGRRIGVTISGGNLDPSLLRELA